MADDDVVALAYLHIVHKSATKNKRKLAAVSIAFFVLICTVGINAVRAMV